MDKPVAAVATISVYGQSFEGNIDVSCDEIFGHDKDIHKWRSSNFFDIMIASIAIALNATENMTTKVDGRPIVVTIDFSEEASEKHFERFIINTIGTCIDTRSIDFVSHTIAVNLGISSVSDNTLISFINNRLSEFSEKYKNVSSIPATITFR